MKHIKLFILSSCNFLLLFSTLYSTSQELFTTVENPSFGTFNAPTTSWSNNHTLGGDWSPPSLGPDYPRGDWSPPSFEWDYPRGDWSPPSFEGNYPEEMPSDFYEPWIYTEQETPIAIPLGENPPTTPESEPIPDPKPIPYPEPVLPFPLPTYDDDWSYSPLPEPEPMPTLPLPTYDNDHGSLLWSLHQCENTFRKARKTQDIYIIYEKENTDLVNCFSLAISLISQSCSEKIISNKIDQFNELRCQKEILDYEKEGSSTIEAIKNVKCTNINNTSYSPFTFQDGLLQNHLTMRAEAK